MIRQSTIDHNPHRQGYFAAESQMRSAVRGQERYSMNRPRRVGFRGALIGMFLIAASLFVALEMGAFDALVWWF